MADLAFVVTIVAVFALVAFVARGGDQAVSIENVVGLIVAVSLVGYLVLALLYPERF